MTNRQESKDVRARIVLGLMIALYALTYSLLDAVRYRYFLYSDIDLAVFAQAVDGVLRGTLFSSVRGMPWLGDHSSLILFGIAPLYAIARHPLTLLVLQSVAQGLGAIPMYALARRETQHGGLALVLAASYLLQPALGYANLFEFHPELLATAPLLAAFYYLRCRRLGLTALWSVLALTCREDVALVVGAMALYAVVWQKPRQARLALWLAGCATLSAGLTWGVLHPLLLHGQASYVAMYEYWGRTPGEIILKMLQDPLGVLMRLFTTPGLPRDTAIKEQFHLTLFLPLGLLPLLSVPTLLLALPVFMEHLLSWRVAQHTILCQYTALQVPFVAAAAAIGSRNLIRLLQRRSVAASPGSSFALDVTGGGTSTRAAVSIVAALVLVASVACQAWFGPLLSSGRFFITGTRGRNLPTAEERTTTVWRDSLLARVPRRGAIVASFEFLDRFSRRDSVYSLHHVLSGTYTFSRLAYPLPTGLSAMIGDLGAPAIVGAISPGSEQRLQELVRDNHLAPIGAAGDLVLFARDAIDTLRLLTAAGPAVTLQPRVGFDHQIAYLGGELVDSTGAPGGLLRIRTSWERTNLVTRYYVARFEMIDSQGGVVYSRDHRLGYLVWPPHAWPVGVLSTEEYRLVLNADIPPGMYDIRLKLRGIDAEGESAAVPDDSLSQAFPSGLQLGRLRVTR